MIDASRRRFNTALAASSALLLAPRIGFTKEFIDDVSRLNATEINALIRVSSYLPYQRWPLPAQFERCYPRATEFLVTKRQWDPDGRFGNRWAAEYLGI
ncbi:MAG: hypothetical protein HY067_10615 [Betaproteobacteria bacterium]|nr:hypothetical protein [Betaproteobacteria bacterium]